MPSKRQVGYPDAFVGARADHVVKVSKSGMEADVILRIEVVAQSVLRRGPMRSTAPRLAAIVLTAVAAFCTAAAADTNALPLRVMTFNLRYASLAPPNAWPQRRPVMQHLIQNTNPDLIGTQEGLLGQLNDLAADLPDYRWIGVGRDDGQTRGEFMAVFYRHERFAPLATNHFWLSDMPEVPGSTTWGNSNRRMVTCVKFRDRRGGREFHFWNTHFDHQIETARQRSALLIRDRLKQLNDALPVLLVGDFNTAAGNSRSHDVLVKEGGMSDAWTLAQSRVNEKLNTFHNYRPVENGERIDWILLHGGAKVSRVEVLNFAENGQFPSDHFPVMAELAFGSTN